MPIERIIGIDFGTSSSVMRVKRYQDGEPVGKKLDTQEVLFNGLGPTVPTLIQKKRVKDEPTVTYFGHEAAQKRRGFTIYQDFKIKLEHPTPVMQESARQLTEEFLEYMAHQYQDQSAGGHLGSADDQERTIVSYPVKWKKETQEFMLDAARKAGFPNVTGMNEAQAAIQAAIVMSSEHLTQNGLLKDGVPSTILLIDMGAGTTDLVLGRYTPGSSSDIQIINTWPKNEQTFFGGREVDKRLQDFFRQKLTEEDAEALFRRVGVDKFKTWKETIVSPALSKKDNVQDFDALDTFLDLMGIEMEDYCLDRSTFEDCMEDYLKQFPQLINDCIRDAGLQGSEVDLVIVTGGHSQWYFVNEILSGKNTRFGAVCLSQIQHSPFRIIPISRPQETVALGLVYSGFSSKGPIAYMEEHTQSEDTNSSADTDDQPVFSGTTDGPISEDANKTAPEETARPQVSQNKKTDPCCEKKPGDACEYTPIEEFELGSVEDCYYIRKYIGNRSVVSIPPCYRGRNIIHIGCDAFRKCTLEKVIIPEMITVIGQDSFRNCTNLHTVIAHPKITRINDNAFRGCRSLQIVYFGIGPREEGIIHFPPDLKEIGCFAFGDPPIVKEVSLPVGAKVHNSWLSSHVTFPKNRCAVFRYQ